MASVSKRVQAILDSESLSLSSRGSDERDMRDIAEALSITLTTEGSDENLIEELEAAVAAL